MKTPIAPKKPAKPRPPNKDQAVYKRELDVDELFFKRQFIAYDRDYGDEIEVGPNEEYSFERIEDLTPSFKDIFSLIPNNIPLEKVFIKINTDPSDGFSVFDGVECWYETPYDYIFEFNKYQVEMLKYEKEMFHYKEVLKPEYDILVKEYQEEKKLKADLATKAELENQLKQLEQKIKALK